MPGQHPDELASAAALGRLQGSVAEIQAELTRRGVLIRQLQGAAGSEVAIQPDEPTDDATELWVDSDASPIVVQARVGGVWTPASGPAGPAGPKGDKGDKGDTGAQGPVGAGGLLDVRTKSGAAEVFSANFSADQPVLLDRVGAGAQNMELLYTPAVNAWWEVTAHIGLLAKVDAAWHPGYGKLQLSPADVDGLTFTLDFGTQHSGGVIQQGRHLSRIYKLAAGTPYKVQLGFTPNGGTWNYYCGPMHLAIAAKAWAR